GRAAVREAHPRGAARALKCAQRRTWRGSDMLHEDELAACRQHASDLAERLSRVRDRAKDESADDGVETGVGQIETIIAWPAKANSQSLIGSGNVKTRVAARVGFDAGPLDVAPVIVEVDAGTRPQLENFAGQRAEKLALARRHLSLAVRIEALERAYAKRARPARTSHAAGDATRRHSGAVPPASRRRNSRSCRCRRSVFGSGRRSRHRRIRDRRRELPTVCSYRGQAGQRSA